MSGSPVAVDSEEEAESRAKLIAGMMTYTGSLAFFAINTPKNVAEKLGIPAHDVKGQVGVKETLAAGTTLHHYSRSVEFILS